MPGSNSAPAGSTCDNSAPPVDPNRQLFWRDRNLRFHAYDLLASSPNVEDLLAELDRDPTCIFWG
jgi:hypothetical protein